MIEKYQKELFTDFLKDFALNCVKPYAKRTDEEERFPIEVVEMMGKSGLLGMLIPEAYQGAGANYFMYSEAVREIASVCATTATILSAHVSLCASPIVEFGTEAQKQKYLPKLANGTWLGSFALTEADAGTDASNQNTKAIDMGDYFLLNGAKTFITNAGHAGLFIIFAMTDKSVGTKGITAFLVERDFPGVSIGKEEPKLGIRGSSTCEVILEQVKVPKDNVLGAVGEGFKIAMKTLDGGRVGIASQALGIAEGAFNLAVNYVKERKQFNRPLAAFQNTQFKIAELATRIEASRLLLLKAVEAKQNNLKSLSLDAAMAKLYTSETAMIVTNAAIQFHGGYGYSREYVVERMFRDAKITEIFEGTSEVQKMVISGIVLR